MSAAPCGAIPSARDLFQRSRHVICSSDIHIAIAFVVTVSSA